MSTTCGAIIARMPRPRRSRRKAHAAGLRRHRVVRRRVLARVGICQAAALAAAQSGQARTVCDRAGALRHGGGDAVRREERERAEAQRVRDGPQVDVESQVGRAAAGGVSGCRGSAVCGRAREDGRRVSDQRSDRRASFARSGQRSWDCARGFRFRWARSMRTGMRSARISAKATW